MRSYLFAFIVAISPLAAAAEDRPAQPGQSSAQHGQSVVFFESRSSGLSPLARLVLDRQAEMLEQRQQPLALIGQAAPDEAMEAESLSVRRAEAVRDYLLARGVRPENLLLGNRPKGDAPAVIATPAPAAVLIN